MTIADMINAMPSDFGSAPPILVGVLLVWILAWKGFALWKSARLNQSIWFVLLLVINTMGILEILYIFVFSRLTFNHLSARKKKK